MAKQNKSAAIRDMLAQYPGAKTSEIVAKLKAAGIKVTPAYVSTVKSSAKRKVGEGEMIAIAAVEEANELIKQAGGVEEAKQLIDLVAQLR